MFFYVSRDQGTFEPDLKELFEMAGKGEVEVRIKRVFRGLEKVPEAHRLWMGLEGMGSVVVKVS